MSRISLKWFGGMVPRRGEQHLPRSLHATEAENCNLYSGELRPLKKPSLSHQFCRPDEDCWRSPLPDDPSVPPPEPPPEPPLCVPVAIESTSPAYDLGDIAFGTQLLFTVTVNADATTPLQYQWYQNGIAIPGAVDSVYQHTVAVEDAYTNFTVSVQNPCGLEVSGAWTLGFTGYICKEYACNSFSTEVVRLNPDGLFPHIDSAEGNYIFDHNGYFKDLYIDVNGSVADSTWYGPPISAYLPNGPDFDDICQDKIQRARYTGGRYDYTTADPDFWKLCALDGVEDWDGSGGTGLSYSNAMNAMSFVTISRRQSSSYWHIPFDYGSRYRTWAYSTSRSAHLITFEVIHDYPNATYPWGSVQVNSTCAQSYRRKPPQPGDSRSSGNLSMFSSERFRPDPLGNGGGTPGADWSGFENPFTPVLWCMDVWWELRDPIVDGEFFYGVNASDTGAYVWDYGWRLRIGWLTGEWELELQWQFDGPERIAGYNPGSVEIYWDRHWYDPYATYKSNATNAYFTTHYNAYQIHSAKWRNHRITDAQWAALLQAYRQNYSSYVDPTPGCTPI